MNNNQLMWKQYIDLFIGNKCKEAMIINKMDATPWAASPDFVLKAYKGMTVTEDGSEVEADIDEEEGFIDFAKTKEKPKHGFRIAGDKYQLLRKSEDGSTLYLKRSKGGAAVTVTERAIVIGTWEEGKAPAPACNQVIEDLGKHLRDHKY